MNIYEHNDISSLDKILNNWSELNKDYHDITIFQDVNWLKSWWEYKTKQRTIIPYILEIKQSNEIVGVFPLYIHVITLAGVNFRILKPVGSELSDYLVPILSKNYSAEEALNLVFAKIMKDKTNWDYFDWGNIPEYSCFDKFLNKKLSSNSKLKRNRIEACPYFKINKDIMKTINNFDQKWLKDIYYKERKIKRSGKLVYQKVITEEEIEPIMKKLFDLHCKRWEKTDTPSRFQSATERDFLLSAAINLHKAKLLHLSYLSHNDEIIAIHFGMSDGKKFYYYIPTFDMNFAKYSVGQLLIYNLILQAGREGCDVFDFLRGNEAYKYKWGASNRYNVRYICFNRTIKSTLFKYMLKTYDSKFFNDNLQPLFLNRISKSTS
ncbi:GNAT family N-acetyltransferase [Bacillus sp. AGMB 02131]|uniref:GNAT family N-acetyltransferase n=1 Tax=Peribacillus faecalis TaxID=2772559 RepID=A0A927CXU6_9BACI|nr:GNAT family N-acetyltransferase [Peribacillus faecalis]MBD3107670.1 GNAT family N-acetyltransferase [Peribacillus faecalis]